MNERYFIAACPEKAAEQKTEEVCDQTLTSGRRYIDMRNFLFALIVMQCHE